MPTLLQDKINHDAAKAPFYERAAREEAANRGAAIAEGHAKAMKVFGELGVDCDPVLLLELLNDENWDTLKEGVAA